MKKILSALFFCTSLNAQASTSITTPTVSGHWAISGSPYHVYNDITVNPGQSLTIEPGVSVIFHGAYTVAVYGMLHAAGTAALPISFSAADTSGLSTPAAHVGGWSGITFNPYSAGVADTSVLDYCDIKHIKTSTCVINRNLHISNSSFSENHGSIITYYCNVTTGSYEVNNCTFFNNYLTGHALGIFVADNTCDVHDNEFYDNITFGGKVVEYDGARIRFVHNSVHHNSANLDCYILSAEGSSGLFRNNRIYENNSVRLAVVFCNGTYYGDGKMEFDGNYICNNQSHYLGACSLHDGGATFHLKGSGNDSGTLYIIRNNIIANNMSENSGGAIFAYNARMLVSNNQIVNNSAHRGSAIDITLDKPASICIRNNVLTGNSFIGMPVSASDAIHISSSVSSVIKFDHNFLSRPSGYDLIRDFTGGGSLQFQSDTTSNMVGADAGMMSPTLTSSVSESALLADFRLSSSSACIGRGVNAAVSPGAADYMANIRIVGDSVDIGAFEYGATAAGPYSSGPFDTVFKNCCYAAALPPILHTTASTAGTASSITIYPDPAHGTVSVLVPRQQGSITIVDISGRAVMEHVVTQNICVLDVHALVGGVYFVIWADGAGGRSIQRVVVQ